jgi:phage terminase large subunit
MQRQEYLITSDSLNLIKGLRNYRWDTDKTGKSLNVPNHNFSDIVDSLRYHEIMTLGLKAEYGKYFIR